MNGLAGIIAIASLSSAFLFAPFHHIHEPGRADRHIAEHHSSGLALHIHIPGASSSDSSWQAADESARLLNWFRAKEAKSISFPAALATVVAVSPNDGGEAGVSVAGTAIVESPALLRVSTRGPPA